MVTSTRYRLEGYPRSVSLTDGSEVVLKPMAAEDGPALYEFFKDLPAGDRFYLKDDVASPEVIKRWVRELDYDRVLPILAWAGEEVVGDATLHRGRAGARRHVAEVRIVVARKYRGRSLGTMLLHELLNIARQTGLERVVMELVAEREDTAIMAATGWGFERAGALPGHARDIDGTPHDVIFMEMPLERWFEGWPF